MPVNNQHIMFSFNDNKYKRKGMVKLIVSRPNEALSRHITLVLEQYENLSKSKNIDKIMRNIIDKLCLENSKLEQYKDVINELFLYSLEFHDEGKKNPYFQSYMGNEKYKDYKWTKLNKHHAEISAIYYCIEMYNIYIEKIKKRQEQEYIKDIILSFAYNIYRHHSNLEDFDKNKFINDLIQYHEENEEQFINIDLKNIGYLPRFKSRSNIKYTNPYTYYILCKVSYSVLVTCDFMAVYNHHNENQLDINIVNNNIKNTIEETFNNDNVIKSIKEFKKNPNIPLSKLNKYRCQMFLESEMNIIKNRDNHLFYLEAPTGSGKSLTSLNLALQLLDSTYNKLYYIAPFNNILEQTHKVIKNNFYNNVVTVNSKEDVYISEIENTDYDKDFLNMQMINYPVSLTSHVRFFNMLFSEGRIHNLMLPTLCNSIIIIDEIQSYKNKIWIHMINTLKETAHLLNIKIIIMSATLPKMNELLEDKNYHIPDLILGYVNE